MSAANGQLQDPAKLGTAIRSISMSLRGASVSDLQAAGIDVQGMTQRKDIGKILKSVAGVDIKKNNDQYKDTYTILGEIADKWSDINDIQKSTIASQLAGKTQGNAFYALMNNWNDVQRAYKTAQNSQGSATRENSAYMESVTARYNQVKASFEDLSRNFLTSGILKTGAGGLNTLLQGVNSVVKTLGGPLSVGLGLGLRSLTNSIFTGQGLGSAIAQAALGTGPNGKYKPGETLANAKGTIQFMGNQFSALGTGFLDHFRLKDARNIGKEVAQKAGDSVSEGAMKAVASDAYKTARSNGLTKEAALSQARVQTQQAAKTGSATLSNGAEIASDATGNAISAATGGLTTFSKAILGIGTALTIATVAYKGFKAIDKAVGLTKGQSIKNMQSSLTAYQNAQEAVTQTQDKIESNASERKTLLNKQNKTLDDQARLQELNTEDQTYTLKQQTQEAKAAQKRQAAAKKITHAVNKYRGNREDVTTADVNRAASAYGKRMQSSGDYNAQQQASTNYDNIIQGNDVLDQLAQLSYWSKVEKSGKSSASQKKSATKNRKSLQSGLNKTLGQYTKFLSAYQQIGYNNLTKGQQDTYDELFKDSDVIQRAMAQSSGNMAQYYSQRAKNVVTDLMSRYSDDITKQMQETDKNFSLGDYADNPLGLLAKVGENQKGGKFNVNTLTGVFSKIRSQLKASGFSKDDFAALNSSVNELMNQTTGTGANPKNNIESNYDTVLSEAKKYQDQLAQIQANYKQAFSAPGMNFEQATSMTAMGFGAALERTAGGIRLNTREYEKLNQAMHQSQISKVSDELDDAYDDFNKIGGKINEIQGKVARGTATKDEMDQLAEYREQYQKAAQNIENLRNRRSAIEGSDSAVTRFVNSGSQGDVGDVLDATAQQITNTKKDYDQGKTSSKQVRDFVAMLTYGDTSNLTNSQVAQAYSGAMQRANLVGSIDKSGNFNYSADKIVGIISDFQTGVQKAGNSGYKLIDTVNKTINGTTQDVQGIAKQKGVSSSFVQEWFNWLGERGWNINIDDSQRKDLSQRLNDADEQVRQINQNGAKGKFYGGKNPPSQEDLDNTVRNAKNAVNSGNEVAYNKTMDTLNSQIDQTNAAIKRAGDAGNRDARNAYGDKLAQQLQARETADSYDHNKIMQTNANSYKGATSDLVTAMQEYQKAQDQLDVGNQMSAQGFQTDIDNLQGKVKDASDQMRTAFQGIFDEGTNKELIGKLNQLGITGGNALAQQIQAALINPDGSLNTGNWNVIKLALQPENKGLTGPEETPSNQNQSNTKPSDKGRAGQESTESETNQERAKEWDERERRNYNARKDRGNGLSGSEESEIESNRAKARSWDEQERQRYNARKNRGTGLSGGETTSSQTNEERARRWNEQEQQRYNWNQTRGVQNMPTTAPNDLASAVREETAATKEHTAATKEGTQTTKQQTVTKKQATGSQQSAGYSNIGQWFTGMFTNPTGWARWNANTVLGSLFGINVGASDTGATVNSTRNWQRYSPVGGPSMPDYMMTYADRKNYIADNTRPLTGQGSTTELTTAVKDNTAATKEGTQTTKQTTIERTVQGVQQGLTGTGTAPSSLGLTPQGWAAYSPNAVQTTSNPFLNGSFTGGQLGQQTAKVKVEADTTEAQGKVKDVGKNSNAKVKVDADTQQADEKAKNVGKGANPKVKVQGDVSDVTKKISSIKAQPIKVKLAVDPTTGTKTNLPNYGGRFALKNPNQYGGGGTTVTQKVSQTPSTKQKLTGTVEYKAEFKTKKAPPLTGVAIYISQFPTKKAPSLSGTATYTAVFPTRSAPTLSGVVHYTSVFDKARPAYKGSAHAGGTVSPGGHAFADGTSSKYTVGRDETALVNELGPELIVRGDSFFIANGGKPGFTGLRSSDIIFNAKQTSQLLTKGYTNTYAHANGTISGPAFAKGSKKKSSGSSDNSENDQDWIEVYLKRIENEISRLDITASSGFKTWNIRMDAYTSEIQKTTQEVGKYSEISQKYLAKANAVGLSDAYKKKVQSGDLSIENISSEDTRKKISTYTQWYEKYLDSLTNEMKLKEQIFELEQKRDQVRLDWLDNLSKESDVRLTQLTQYTPYSHQQGRIDQAWLQEYDNRYADREQSLRSQHLEIAARMNQYTVGSDQWRTLERSMQDVDNQMETLFSTQAENLANAFSTIIQSIEDSLDKIVNTARILNTSTGQFDGVSSAMTNITGQAEKLSDAYFNEAQALTRILNSYPESRKYSAEWYKVLNQRDAALKNARNTYSTVKSSIDDLTSIVINNLEAIRQVQSTLQPVLSGTTVTGTGNTVSNLDQQLKAYRDQRNTKIDTLNWGIKRGEVTIGDSQYTKVLTENAQNQISAANAVSNAFSDVQSYYSAATSQLQLLNDEVTKYNALTEDGGKSVKSSSIATLYENADKTVTNLYQQYKDLQDVINTGLKNGTIFVGSTKYNELKQKQNEFRKNLEQTFTDASSNIDTLFSALTEHLSSTNDLIQQYISNTSDSGHAVGEAFYNALISSAQQEIGLKEQEKTALEANLQQGLASGAFGMYGTDWYNLKKKIDDCDKSILQAQGSIIKYNNSLNDLKWDAVDKVTDRFDDQVKELSFLSGLIDDSDMWDENNQFTDSYLGKMGLLTSEYDANFKAAQSLDDVIAELQKDLEADPSNDTLHKKLDSFLGKKQNYITAAHSLRKEITELANSNLSKLQNQLSKLISQYEKLLDAEKDQMSYQKSITKAQETVDTLQKQVMSYTGDTSEEGQAKLQKARKDLKDAQDDLKEKQDDKRISDIKALLSELQDNFSTAIDNYMKNAEQVLIDQIALVNANQDTVKDEINKTATDNGYKVSNATQALLAPTTETQNMVSAFKGDFDDQSALAVSSLDNIQNTVQSFIDEANQNAQNQIAALESMQNANQAAEDAAAQRGQALLDATIRAAQAAQAAAAAAGSAVHDNAITDQQGILKQLDETAKNNTWIGRYRNQSSGNHVLIDQNSREAQNAMDKGYNQEEGTGFYSNNDKDTRVAVTRLYNAKTGQHLYTTSGGEASSLEKSGWTKEPKSTIYGTSDTKNGNPVYRMYNANTGEHLYTINSHEKDNLVKAGWKYEGIGWYAPKNIGNYASGTRSNKVKGNYWTQENGKQEAIIRKSDGAILTPLAQGDAVLNGKATQRLYDMANNPQSFFKHTTVSTDVPKTNVNNDINVTFNLPNVQNSDEFIRELQTNPKMEKLIQEMTLGQLNGNNSLKKRGIRVV